MKDISMRTAFEEYKQEAELRLSALESHIINQKSSPVTVNSEIPKHLISELIRSQVIAFDEWRIENCWFSFEQGHYYRTLEQGSLMSTKQYLTHYIKTREELYDMFIAQQNK